MKMRNKGIRNKCDITCLRKLIIKYKNIKRFKSEKSSILIYTEKIELHCVRFIGRKALP